MRLAVATLALAAVPALAGEASLRWDPYEPEPIDGFRVYVDGAIAATVLPGDPRVDLVNVPDCQAHTFGVTAFKGARESDPATVTGWPRPRIDMVTKLPSGQFELIGANFMQAPADRVRIHVPGNAEPISNGVLAATIHNCNRITATFADVPEPFDIAVYHQADRVVGWYRFGELPPLPPPGELYLTPSVDDGPPAVSVLRIGPLTVWKPCDAICRNVEAPR